MNIYSKRVSEDWIKEYEKILLTREIHRAGKKIGETEYIINTVFNPVVKRKKIVECIAVLTSLISSIPILKEHEEIINTWQKRLTKIKSALYGNENAKKELGINLEKKRISIHIVEVPDDESFNVILDEIKKLFEEINKFTTEGGLRITLPVKRKLGAQAIMEKEGFSEEDLELFD